MYVYEHNGKNFISINGKDYFLIRGYENTRGNFIFIQVTGKTPLNKEDLPSNVWCIVKTRIGKQRVWTAFSRSYFRYYQNKDDMILVFIGSTTKGSCYLALQWINENFKQKLDQQALIELAEKYSRKELSNHNIKLLDDRGNFREKAVYLEISSYFDENKAERILKGGT